MISLPRSLLYVPGDRPELRTKALAAGADAVIIDLEDAVLPAHRQSALESTKAFLANLPQGAPAVWVRVGPDLGGSGAELECAGLIVAKASVAAIESACAGRPELPVIALIEDAAALQDLRALAEHPQVAGLALGEADLRADLRLGRAAPLDHFRAMVVVAAAAAHLPAPISSTSTDFRDLDAFARTTAEAKERGFGSRTAIHPAQVPIINSVFTPDGGELAAALEVLAALERSPTGRAIDRDGRFIDEAVARSARAVVARAEQFAAGS